MKQATLRSKSARVLLWMVIILSGSVVASCISKSSPNHQSTPIPTSVNPTDDTPSKEEYPNTQLSENGTFKVSYIVSTGEIPINQMHQWTLHVETADGQLVEDATISVDGDMPAHGHGLPTRPRVTQYLGDGNYLVEGMKFQMGGFWVMEFTVTTNDQTDTVHFDMQLK